MPQTNLHPRSTAHPIEANAAEALTLTPMNDAIATINAVGKRQRVIAATHNRLAVAVYESVLAVRHERPWLKLKRGHTDAALWRHYQADHSKIAEALLARDAVAAGEAIRAHLVDVRAKMLGH
jgi:hypothetical protein